MKSEGVDRSKKRDFSWPQVHFDAKKIVKKEKIFSISRHVLELEQFQFFIFTKLFCKNYDFQARSKSKLRWVIPEGVPTR